MRALLLLTVAALTSCALGSEASIGILLPQLPGPWRAAFPDMRCLLVCQDGSGDVHQTLLPGWDSGAIVTCGKAGNTPVLAYPVSSRDLGACPAGNLRPAGALYPGSLEEQAGSTVLRLTWEDGAAASILLELRSAGRDTSLFNAPRLCREMREAIDPWDLDLPTISEAIAAGEFNVYDLRELSRRDVTVDKVAGQWVLESPFRGLLTAGPDGTVQLLGMTLGAHCMYSTDGRVMRVQVREKETIVLRVR